MEDDILGLDVLTRLKATIDLGNQTMERHIRAIVRKKVHFKKYRSIIRIIPGRVRRPRLMMSGDSHVWLFSSIDRKKTDE